MSITRRQAIHQLSMWAAASPLLGNNHQDELRRRVFEPDRIAPLEELVNAFEFEDVAQKKLPETLYNHIAGGAGTERTLRRNRKFFEQITFRPRMLVDVSTVDLSVELFGNKLFSPIFVGPSANHARLHAEAENATVRGAELASSVVVISQRSSQAVDKLATQISTPIWFQTDAETGDATIRAEVQRAADAGCQLICLTIGNRRHATSRRDIHSRWIISNTKMIEKAENSITSSDWPPEPSKLRERGGPQLTWDLIDKIKEWSGLPVILKGVMSRDEASQAVANGIDGIVVSNYGGRTIDGVAATSEVLPGIADEIEGRVPIFVDGGFRRGVDILKGLALGASGIWLGRPILWALAGYGEAGVAKMLQMLQMELAVAMALSGKPNIGAIDRSLVKVDRW